MFTKPQKQEEKNINLTGAVQINHSSFLVYKNGTETFLQTGNNEKLHKTAVLNMIKSNPHVERLLKRFRIKPTIDTKTLNELTAGHMNDTCNIAMGVYSILSNEIKSIYIILFSILKQSIIYCR